MIQTEAISRNIKRRIDLVIDILGRTHGAKLATTILYLESNDLELLDLRIQYGHKRKGGIKLKN